MGSLNPMTSRPVIASPKSARLQDSLRSLLVEDAGLRDKLMPAFSDELLRHMRGEKQECGSTYFAWRAGVCVASGKGLQWSRRAQLLVQV